MSSNVANQVSYLRTTRSFPKEIGQLAIECDRAYIDVANSVNQRTIGIFSTNIPAITGESWFISKAQRQQSLRQVYNISSFSSIPHNIDTTRISNFTVIRGCAYNGTHWYPIPYVDAVAPTNNIGIYISTTQINFTNGGSATITSGIVVLEWLSMV